MTTLADIHRDMVMMSNDIKAEIKAAAIEARAYSEAVAVALAGNDPARYAVAERMMSQTVDAVRRLEDLVDRLRAVG